MIDKAKLRGMLKPKVGSLEVYLEAPVENVSDILSQNDIKVTGFLTAAFRRADGQAMFLAYYEPAEKAIADKFIADCQAHKTHFTKIEGPQPV